MTALLAFLGKIENDLKKAKALRPPEPPDYGGDLEAYLGWKLRPHQSLLLMQEARFNVQVLHRRFGKTVLKVFKLIQRAINCPFPNPRFAYIAPTYSMAEDIAWLYLEAMTKNIPGVRLEKSRLAVWIPNRHGGVSRIRLYGADSPKQRLRGLYLDGVVFDEFAWTPWSAWVEQVRPMLADISRRGLDGEGHVNQWADFIFTPYGRNHCYHLYNRALKWMNGQQVEVEADGKKIMHVEKGWTAALLTAADTGVIPPEELKSIMVDSGRSKFAQEMMCDFDAAVEGAIYGAEMTWLRSKGRLKTYEFNPALPVHTGWDLGFHPDPTCVWFAQYYSETDIRLIEYTEFRRATLEQLARHLLTRAKERGYRYGTHFMPPDVNVAEMGTGKSRRAILREHGVRVRVIPKHTVHDGIAAVQAALPYCRFNEPLTMLGIDCLSLYRRVYNEKLGVHSEAPQHDRYSHGADAIRYLILGLTGGGDGEGGKGGRGGGASVRAERAAQGDFGRGQLYPDAAAYGASRGGLPGVRRGCGLPGRGDRDQGPRLPVVRVHQRVGRGLDRPGRGGLPQLGSLDPRAGALDHYGPRGPGDPGRRPGGLARAGRRVGARPLPGQHQAHPWVLQLRHRGSVPGERAAPGGADPK